MPKKKNKEITDKKIIKLISESDMKLIEAFSKYDKQIAAFAESVVNLQNSYCNLKDEIQDNNKQILVINGEQAAINDSVANLQNTLSNNMFENDKKFIGHAVILKDCKSQIEHLTDRVNTYFSENKLLKDRMDKIEQFIQFMEDNEDVTIS